MREVGKRIISFGVIFKKIKPVKDLVKSVFNNKTEKKTFRQNTSSKTGDVLRVFTLPLKRVEAELGHRQWARLAHWSGLTSPPSSFFLCPERRRDSGDQRRRAAAPRGLWRAGMDPRIKGDPTGSRWVGGDGVSCRRRAPRRRKASGKSGFGAAVVLDRNGVGGRFTGG